MLDGHLDDQVELGDERFERDVDAAQELLRRAPVGTSALLYNGFGGTLPAGYRQLRVDTTQACELSLWRKLSSDARVKLASTPRS